MHFFLFCFILLSIASNTIIDFSLEYNCKLEVGFVEFFQCISLKDIKEPEETS